VSGEALVRVLSVGVDGTDDLRIGPLDDVTTTTTYLPDTAVLRHEYAGASGRARSTIAMRWPVEPGSQELLWLVEGLEGQLTFQVNVRPEPGFGRQGTPLTLAQHLITFTGDHPAIDLTTAIPVSDMNRSASGSAVLRAGQQWGFRLRVGQAPKAPSQVVDPADVARDLEQTAQAWRDWAAGITYSGPVRENVIRSAVTLKLLHPQRAVRPRLHRRGTRLRTMDVRDDRGARPAAARPVRHRRQR
jgi:hypothetical protein